MTDSVKVIYKIRRKSDGLFAVAGAHFTKNGKSWNHLAHLRTHLNQNLSTYKKGEGYEIVVYQLSVVENGVFDLDTEVQVVRDRIKQRENEQKVEAAKRKQAEAERTLASLKKTHPDLFK